MMVLDYWRWAHGDILENVQRGIFAEFLVGAALGITGEARVGWAGYDLNYDGYKIEVKSSAFLQAWTQSKLSKISFGIGPKIQFNPEGDTETDPRRVADCFVFCVFADTDPEKADVLDTGRWYFYVVPISRLVEFWGVAKSVVENRVRQITTAVHYAELKGRVDATRAGDVFEGTSSISPASETQRPNAFKTYGVWERGTRLYPVIVQATNVEEAYLLARADASLARLGTTIAGLELSCAQLAGLLADGAVDLRSRKDSRDREIAELNTGTQHCKDVNTHQ